MDDSESDADDMPEYEPLLVRSDPVPVRDHNSLFEFFQAYPAVSPNEVSPFPRFRETEVDLGELLSTFERMEADEFLRRGSTATCVAEYERQHRPDLLLEEMMDRALQNIHPAHAYLNIAYTQSMPLRESMYAAIDFLRGRCTLNVGAGTGFWAHILQCYADDWNINAVDPFMARDFTHLLPEGTPMDFDAETTRVEDLVPSALEQYYPFGVPVRSRDAQQALSEETVEDYEVVLLTDARIDDIIYVLEHFEGDVVYIGAPLVVLCESLVNIDQKMRLRDAMVLWREEGTFPLLSCPSSRFMSHMQFLRQS